MRDSNVSILDERYLNQTGDETSGNDSTKNGENGDSQTDNEPTLKDRIVVLNEKYAWLKWVVIAAILYFVFIR
jgi:hypothetical protein